jgi:hypothetical protein
LAGHFRFAVAQTVLLLVGWAPLRQLLIQRIKRFLFFDGVDRQERNNVRHGQNLLLHGNFTLHHLPGQLQGQPLVADVLVETPRALGRSTPDLAGRRQFNVLHARLRMGRQVLNVESHAGKRVAQRPLQEAVSKAENGRVASVLLPRFSALWIFQPVTKLVVELIQF